MTSPTTGGSQSKGIMVTNHEASTFKARAKDETTDVPVATVWPSIRKNTDNGYYFTLLVTIDL